MCNIINNISVLIVILASAVIALTLGSNVVELDSAESLHPQDHRRHHRHNTTDVYWQRIGDAIWAEDYRNPCQSGPEDYEGETVDPASMISSLNIANREDVLRAKAGNLLARMRHLERFVPIGECLDERLSSLPHQPMAARNSNDTTPYFTGAVLEKLYNTYLYVSIHYRFMASDWEMGRSCYYTASRREALIDSFRRNGQEFEHAMCMLMAPVSQGSPYPNAAIQERVYSLAMEREVLHYVGDCIGRIKRDCIVHRYVETMLQKILEETTKIIQNRRRSQNQI